MRKIRTVEQLYAAALGKKSVTVPESNGWKGPMPAAFMINQSGAVLCRLFLLGMFIYEPRSKRRYGGKV